MLILSIFGLWVGSITLAVSFLAFVLYYAIASRRPKSFPPGPATIPVLGNLHLISPTKSYLQFHEWTKQYGSIIGLKFGPQDVVVLNNWKHVKELFDKRGAISSSRPPSYIGNELICPNETHVLLVQYGDGWRALRKTVQALLNVTAVDNMLPIQNAEACNTIHQIMKDPGNYYDHVRRYSTAVILASVYGQRGVSFESPKVKELYHVQDQFTALLEPGAAPPVDAFPFLKYMPEFLSPWKTKAKAIQAAQRDLYFRLFAETEARLEKGLSSGCFMEKMIDLRDKNGLRHEQIVYLGGELMEAGSDTTSSTLLSFLLALVNYPRALKACQEELDRVCGSDRSPTADDIGQLPYIKACMQETLRWRPTAPAGVPHVLTQDESYGDYVLKKGTMIFANTWSIGRDEEEFDDPEEFIPERFMESKFGTRKSMDVDDNHRRVTYGFGAGRRVCSGQRLAENSLMVNMAKLCWAFNITSASACDTNVETAYSSGFLICPLKFPATFVPRSEKHAKVIEAEYMDAERFLQQYE